VNAKIPAAARQRLAQKIAKNRALGNRTDPETEAKVIEEYTTVDGASYRSVAMKFHLAVGTVARIMRRVGGVPAVIVDRLKKS